MDIAHRTRRARRDDSGFTLVELLIVIVILGILATVTVFAVRGITTRGKESACSADKKTLETAVEAYFANNGGSTIPEVAPATAEDTLVTTGLLRSASKTYNVTASGGVTAETSSSVLGSTTGCA
jgi:general secretion pathway protein G